MNSSRLTTPSPAATTAAMQGTGQGQRRSRGDGRVGARTFAAVMVIAGAMGTSGCISVNAPDKPIVIELNINIKQEVIYRLAADVKENIDANPDIF